ncbi:unnamed protein product [Mytilus edulis]|uniref:Uncharacterized protein n=1 Tax=Mytilus edulis TaxID=6550 RepID=A0A8S3SSI2_MYTED|nr:unnamed protein product [Mytilus edulis]
MRTRKRELTIHHDQLKPCLDRNIPPWLKYMRHRLLQGEVDYSLGIGQTEEENSHDLSQLFKDDNDGEPDLLFKRQRKEEDNHQETEQGELGIEGGVWIEEDVWIEEEEDTQQELEQEEEQQDKEDTQQEEEQQDEADTQQEEEQQDLRIVIRERKKEAGERGRKIPSGNERG